MLQHQRTFKESLLGSWVQQNTSSPLDVQDQAEALLRVVAAEPLLQLLSVRLNPTADGHTDSSQQPEPGGQRRTAAVRSSRLLLTGLTDCLMSGWRELQQDANLLQLFTQAPHRNVDLGAGKASFS